MTNKKSTPIIEKPEHYFNVWLKFRRIDERAKIKEQIENEISLDALAETKYGEAEAAVNKHHENFALSEAENSEFAWMELFTNERLYEIMSSLSKREKTILTLRMQSQWNFSEIGLELGISPDAANSRFLRILRKIKKYF